MPDIVVIGGGITGTATTDALAREGHAVTLIEARSIAAMASGWTLGGVRQSGRDPAELPLASAAVALWAGLRDVLDTDVEYRRNGNLRLARTPAEVDVIRTLVASQRARGLDIDFLPDAAAVRAIAPALSPDILAASFCPTDGHANPIKATHAFAESARRHGATIREGVAATAIRAARDRVTGVETDAGFIAANRVVVAAGVNTAELLRPLDLDLPLSIKIVTVVQSEPLAPCLDQVFGVANADCAGRQEADGRLRYTGGLGEWGFDPAQWTTDSLAPSASDVRKVVALVARVLPAAGSAPIARTWRGLIDLTPDALPVIDAPESVAGLVVAAGFSGHGFCLGPISGLLCADLALARRPRLDLSAFRLGRFKDKAIAAAEPTLHG
ncbi:MAG TPA: FAD-binding oxidoreductase [Casimicrobiaceae bacterium]|nr:FAD-binding oxidoreductase [Casimicrobiaceae bacterium]